MSVALVKKVIKNFIESDNSDFLLLKGGWGVGKTYFWSSNISEASKAAKVGKESYAYVSLFGLTDLESLKGSILAAKVNSHAVAKSSNESFSQAVSGFKETFKDFEKIPWLRNYTGGMVGAIAFRAIEKTLICFDDLERKSDEFDIKEILGLASYLKEQRNCKIVFISNEGTLSDEDIKEFGRHSEKVVDIQVTFAPTAEEAFEIAFTRTEDQYALVREYCLRLGVKNIRVLKRIKRFLHNLKPHLEGREKAVKVHIISSLILAVWSYYDKDSNPPSLEVIEKFSFPLIRMKSGLTKELIDEDDQRTCDLLYGTYGYYRTDPLDIEVFKLVRTGFIDENTFLRELESENQKAIARKGNETFSQIWKMFHSSFADNMEEFVKSAAILFEENVPFLALSDVESIVSILRSLGRDSEADTMIDRYLATHNDVFTSEFRGTVFYRHLKDEYFKEKVDLIIPTSSITGNFDEAMQLLVDKPGYEYRVVQYLASIDDDDFYEKVKLIESEKLYSMVRACLQMKEIDDEGGRYNEVARKMSSALERIATEADINRIRIAHMFQIDISSKA
ncbi:MAG: hypothetical protein KA746_14765 [Pyrinomonadaceae bacterium]|nr:hypothetical protein [Pyrinomonadaceae bacterium]